MVGDTKQKKTHRNQTLQKTVTSSSVPPIEKLLQQHMFSQFLYIVCPKLLQDKYNPVVLTYLVS